MKRERTVYTVALAVGLSLTGALRAYGCGTDRWPPKVFADKDITAIDTRPIETSIAALSKLQAPSALPYANRIKPVETSVYRVANVTLTSIQLAPDGDYELYLQDASGNRMVVESPDERCLASGTLSSQAAAVHRELEQRYHPALVPVPVNQRVTVAGVGFFDYVLSEPGHASNGIELHPLLGIAFDGAAPARRRMTTATSAAPFTYGVSTAAAPSTLFYTYRESGAVAREMDPSASGTLSTQTLSYAGGESGANFGWVSASGTPGTASWPAQTYTLKLDVTAPNANLRITEVKVYRVDSNAGPSSSGLAVVGDLKTSASLGAAGTLTFNVPGAAQSANTTDRIAAKFYVANASSVSQSFGYQAGAGTLSVFSAPTSGPGPTPTPAPTPAPTMSPTAAPTPTPAATPGNGSAAYEQSVESKNPKQYYPLNDASGTAVTDDSASHANGTYDGGVTLGAAGPLISESSTAMSADAGAFDVGAHLPAPNISAGSSFSIETWVYPIYSRTYMTIWGSDSSRRLLLGTNGVLLSQFGGNFSSKHTLSASGWHQVVYVFNASSKTQTYYIDGAVDASASLSSATFDSPYYLGEYDNSANYKWHGRIAQHAVYPFALTASQVLADYHAAGYPPTSATPQPAATPSPAPDSPCAGYRWDVKVVNGTSADEVELTPVQTTSIPALTAIPQPNADNVLPRMSPAETSVYQLTNVTLTEIFKSSDYDYHLLLSDGQGHTMIAESPDPSCGPGSRFSAQLTSVRNTIESAYPNITSSGVQVNRPVTLEGIPFFDYVPNYATDESPDGIEIHPILAICFGSNCTLPTVSATPTPVPTTSPTPTPAPTPTPVPTATPASAYAAAVLTDGPKQYYKLDESGGTSAADSSGNAQNGSYVGAVSFGKPGPLLDEPSSAIGLSGGTAGAGVSLPNPNAGTGTSFSIEAWVYPVLGSSYMTIWGYDASHRMLLSSNGLLLTQFGTNFFSKHALSTQHWHHIVFVYDAAAQQGSYYIDGALDSTTSITNAAAAFTAPYFLGQYDTSSNYKWNGSIAQAAFYPAALSLSQVSAHYNAAGYGSTPPTPVPSPSATPVPSPSPTATPTPMPSPSATPAPSPSPSATPAPSPSASPASGYAGAVLSDTPLQYLQLEDQSGPAATDSSGNGQNGTYTGAVTFGAAGPLRNQSSTAISLGGGSTSAGVLVPNPSAAAGSSYSLEIWVYPNPSSNYMTLWGYDTAHRLLLSSNGFLLSQFSGNFFSKGTLSRSTWHDVVFTYDASTQTAAYYIDGQLDSTAQVAASSAAFAASYYLGQYDTGSYYKWSGRLAQFAFYRTALSASQVAAHYTAAGY